MKGKIQAVLSLLWVRGWRIAYYLRRRRRSAPGPESLQLGKEKKPRRFINGVNLPWLSYGNDFGRNAWNPLGGVSQKKNRIRLERIFRRLRKKGIGCIRWFMLGDGRSGILIAAREIPAGLDDRLFCDIDTAIELAMKHKLKIIFVLFDFLLFNAAKTVNGVQLGGRRQWITSRAQLHELFKHVLIPILKRYGRNPGILAWDILNEPEWVTLGMGGLDPRTSLPPWRMRKFLKKTAAQIHHFSKQMATVGLANAAGLPLVRNIGLDLFQVHWYDRFDASVPLDRPVRNLGLNRPLLLGEFPTRNTAKSRSKIVALARRNGYCGAMAWSLLAADRSSGMSSTGKPKTYSISGRSETRS